MQIKSIIIIVLCKFWIYNILVILNGILKSIFQFYMELGLWLKFKERFQARRFLGLSKNWIKPLVWDASLRRCGTYCPFLKIQQILRNTILMQMKHVSDNCLVRIWTRVANVVADHDDLLIQQRPIKMSKFGANIFLIQTTSNYFWFSEVFKNQRFKSHLFSFSQ